MLVEIPLLGKFLSSATSRHLDDIVDRLHFVGTVTVLVLCAMFVGAKQHFGQPIQCMLPAHLDRGSWTSYGQYFCFVESTYRLTYNKTLPSTEERISLKKSSGIELNYYQWVPYFFAIQALMFYIPSWIWHTLQQCGILDMQTVVDEAVAIRNTTKMEERSKKLDKAVEFIRCSFEYRDSTKQSAGCFAALSPTKLGFYSTAVYMLTKLVWIANDAAQIMLIGRFLGIDSITWALQPTELITAVTSGGSPATIHYFPRVTFCDMERYIIGQVEHDTFQCVLMLNVINEKLFLMLWYWIAFLLVIAIINFVYTISQLVQPWCRDAIIRFYVQSDETDENECFAATSKENIHKFINDVLGADGVLMLRFVHTHAGAIVARDITVRLYRVYNCIYPVLPANVGVDSGWSDTPKNGTMGKNPFYWKATRPGAIASAPEPSMESVDVRPRFARPCE
uniref:Innexin n=1 Tax=Ascaris suum TaxID=6253 RepID=F1L4F5_ASCSU